ncbi:hypothetical protein PFLUV_G00048210 [Perca fluviatilis]|uniref:Uncharacterized protein n=1 Tax=Perca fluviatilis TaxID=8168 RepID=A0A6A5F9Y9_PERFL|nr:hypothetical protein PFLUV_G00048210 [Perca fluviatilis]
MRLLWHGRETCSWDKHNLKASCCLPARGTGDKVRPRLSELLSLPGLDQERDWMPEGDPGEDTSAAMPFLTLRSWLSDAPLINGHGFPNVALLKSILPRELVSDGVLEYKILSSTI